MGWPALPLEAAITLNMDRYLGALRKAIAGDHAEFFRVMLAILRDAIAIGEKMMPVIKHQRDRLIETLASPRFLGPDTNSRCLREWSEEVLRDVLFEDVGRDEGGIVADKLHRLGFLECSQVGGKSVYGVPAVTALLASLPEMVGNSSRKAG